jgi:cobalamin-dependent methionine synthase I
VAPTASRSVCAHALVKGIDTFIDTDTEEARAKARPPARS